MIKRIASLLLVLVVITTARGQFTELIQTIPGTPVDAEFDQKGNFYVGGATNVAPRLTKLDQQGALLWSETFSFPANHEVVFQKITIDVDNNIYAFGCDSYYQQNGNFIMKIDSNGNEVWRSTQLPGYYKHASPKNQLFIDDDFLFLINVIDDYIIFEKFNNITGSHILSDTIIDQDTSNIFSLNNFNFSHALETETGWLCSDDDYIAEVDTSGSIEFTVLGDSLPGQLLGKVDNQNFSFQNVFTGKVGYFRTFETVIHTFSSSWDHSQSYNVFDDNMLMHSDSMLQETYNGILVPERGVILAGTYLWTNGQGVFNPLYRERYIMQVDHRTGNIIKYDTNIDQLFKSVDICQYEDKIYAVGSNTGKVYKISPLDLPPASIDNLNNEKAFSVYPNPSNSFYNLESNKRIKEVSVYDLRGSLIMQKRINSKRSRVQLKNSGVYLMQIEDIDGNITTKKVVKW